ARATTARSGAAPLVAFERARSTPSTGAISDWRSLTIPHSPTPRWAAPLVYDPDQHALILQGGSNPLSLGAQTWSFTNGTWTNITAISGVNPPELSAMVYDPDLAVIVGYGSVGSFPITWEFDHGTWKNVTSGSGPSARSRTMMTYDPVDHAVLLFGGEMGGAGASFNDTWEFGSTGWVQLHPTTAPSTRARGMLSWDPLLGSAVLFGGFSAYGVPDDGDTWEFANNQWAPVVTTQAPSSRDGSMFVYDPNVNAIVLFGGFYTNSGLGQGVDNDTWYFNGTWNQVQPLTNPSGRALQSAAFDPEMQLLYAFGGYGFPTPMNDSWAWIQPLSSASINASVTVGEVGIPVGFNVTTIGGWWPFNATWTFGDGNGGFGAMPSHAYLAQGTYTVNVTVRDALGTTSNASVPIRILASSLLLGPVTASVREGVVGGNVGFNATPTGGVTPYNWTWVFGPGSGIEAFGPTPNHAATTTGNESVGVTVRDAIGVTVNGSLTLPVGTVLQAFPPVPRPTPVADGNATGFSVSFSGGLAPYNFSWTFGDGGVAYGATPTHTYSKNGSFSVNVTITDAYGLEVNASLRLSVAPHATASTPPTPGSGSGPAPLPLWLWAVLAAVLVAAAAAVVAVYLRRRPPRSPTEDEPTPEDPSSEEPPLYGS
ncbi:MAG: PKD domain-containing protein, partial [Thermoplasmata archaeon]|nr:PKD domain-containing protein [Thermoplasmata archaeon]